MSSSYLVVRKGDQHPTGITKDLTEAKRYCARVSGYDYVEVDAPVGSEVALNGPNTGADVAPDEEELPF